MVVQASKMSVGWLSSPSEMGRGGLGLRLGLVVELLLLHLEKSQMRRLGHLVRMPPGCIPGEVFRARPSGRRPLGRLESRWGDDVSQLAWDTSAHKT